MNRGTELVQIALLGTRRRQLETDEAGYPLQQLLNQLPKDNAEHQLLSAAGSTFLYQQIGTAPPQFPRELPGPPAAPDPRPVCGAATTRLLESMLTGPQRSYLPECLQLLNDEGRRLPPSLVPNMLALGFKTMALRPLIIPLLSPVDRQLAADHPDWIYASPSSETWTGARAIWQNLSQVGKTRFMQQLRVTDPDLARDVLESTWKTEQDNVRMNLIKQFETGLSIADEPFLEIALDDRGYNIRRRASELLAAIPGSRLGERMIGHVQHFLRWTPEGIKIRFPQVTPEMVRDGVYGIESKKVAHVRSRQLIQMVGAIPLSYWTSAWHPDPETIIDAVMATNWKRTITTGFAEAAVHQQDDAWARAVLWGRGPDLLPIKLVDVLTTNDYANWLIYLMQSENGRPKLHFRGPIFKSIRHRSKIDDLPLAVIILEIIAAYLAQETAIKKASIYEQRAFVAIASRRPVAVLPEAEALFGDTQKFPQPWQQTAEKILNTLRFRRDMLEKVASGE